MKISHVTLILLAMLAFGIIVSPSGRNTEMVCFDSDGNVVLYAQGFNPDKKPAVKLTDGVYKVTDTGEKLKADCRFSWGSTPPKGREYWETK